MPTYNSKLSKEIRKENFEKFVNDEIQYLVDVNGIKESVNVPNLAHLLVLSPDASEPAFLQTLGRGCRLVLGNIANFIVLCAKDSIESIWLKKATINIPEDKITRSYFNLQTKTFNKYEERDKKLI